MTRCYTCQSYRRFLRSSGMPRWRTWNRLCWMHWSERHARLHIAGRLALLLICALFVVGGLGLLIQIVRIGLDGAL